MKNIGHSVLLDCENRRIAQRLRKAISVKVQDQIGDTFETHTINISQTGMRLVFNKPINMDQDLELDLELESGVSISFTGRTVWQRPVGTMGVQVVGLAFQPTRQLSSPLLVGWLRKNGAAA